MPPQLRHSSLPVSYLYIPLILMAGAAMILSLTTSISMLIPAGIWGFVLSVGLLLKFRPPLADTLYFFYPLIFPLIPALVGLVEYHNWFALVWVFGLTVLLVIDGWKANWKKSWVGTSYLPLLCAYCTVLIVSIFTNPMNEHTLSFMLQTLATIPVYWMITQSLTEYDLNRFMKAFVLAAVLSSLAFMFFFFYSTPQVTIAGFLFGFLRPMVLGVNANMWPYPSLIAFPIIVTYFVHTPLTRRYKVWFSAALIMVSTTVVINMSRSVILGLLGATLFILWTHVDWRRRLIIGGIALGIVALVTLPLYYDIIEGIFRLKAGLTGRDQLWRMSFMAIMHDPWFGLGPANLQERFILISPFMRNGAMMNASMPSAHNLYLQVAVEIGVLGALISLAIMLLFFYRSWKLWSQLKGTPLFPVLVALTGVVLAAFLRSFFESELALQHGHLYRNLFVLIALAFQDQLSHRAARDYGR